MNFLAHLFLSGDDIPLLLGNFMGDFVDNRQLGTLVPEIRFGVRVHREIDAFTDPHPEVLSGKKRLYNKHGKYAPVLTDIFYDYLLAKNWHLYSEETLDDFVDRMYEILSSNSGAFPPRLQKQLPHMIEDDWLRAYARYSGLEITFHYLQRRVSRPVLIEGAVESLKETEPLFTMEFNAFFPDLQAHVSDIIQQSANLRNGKQS